MSEHKIQLTGGKALAAVVVLIGLFLVRVATLDEGKDDEALMRELQTHLLAEYLPSDAHQLQEAYDTGDADQLEEVATSVSSTRLNVESVKLSYPLFEFSTTKDVVVKVTYTLDDVAGTRQTGTQYYRFKHNSLGNIWRYRRETSATSYYLNFI